MFIIRGFIVTDRGRLSIAILLRLSVLLPPVYGSAELTQLTAGQTAAVDDIE